MTETNQAQLVLFDTVFNALSALNSKVRSDNPDLVQDDSPFEIFRDYATISFDAGQRTGKSVWVNARAPENSAIVTLTDAQATFYPSAKAFKYSMPFLRSYTDPLKSFRYIFVEQAAWFDKKDIALVYQLFGTSKNTFVFLG